MLTLLNFRRSRAMQLNFCVLSNYNSNYKESQGNGGEGEFLDGDIGNQ